MNGTTNTWRLPLSWRNQSTLNLYELTADGRKFVNTVNVSNGNVTLTTDALRAYVITTDTLTTVSNNNMALTATITASSNSDANYNSTTHMFNGMEYRYITNVSAPNNDWTTVLKNLTSGVMIDSQAQSGMRCQLPQAILPMAWQTRSGHLIMIVQEALLTWQILKHG